MPKKFVISKQSDIDGFNSFRCSLCGDEFKLKTSEVQEDDVLEIFCPNCGIPSLISSYYTDDFIEHAQTFAMNEAIESINDMLRGLERKFRKNKHITFKTGRPIATTSPLPLYEQDNLEQVQFLCCDKNAKLTLISKVINPYCPYCGVN
ncbi:MULTISPECIES: hypothetical protein [Paenibacillus]|uniref:TFIIB-type zinc ribbon-containing protein n=1 Tax=Paenibacillus lautus TaxID=1401 RepID=A0A1R1B679_PAELA|nr:hypothetical protein [Paenibacillus lautus]OME94969.1 hypothetical protein BK123_07715 [Paenibacillus lautus]